MKLKWTAVLAAAMTLGATPVYGNDDVTNTTPAVYKTVADLEAAVADYPEVKTLAFDPYADATDKGTYVIPGLDETATLNYGKKEAECTSMTPQGVTETDQYLLISAYCHEHVHYSVIYVLDRATHEYVNTVVLDGMPHTGSIAYDANEDVVWVATHEHGKATASSVAMSDIENYAPGKPVKWQQTYVLEGLPADSYLCMDGDQLVAGTFEKEGNVRIHWYDIDDSGLTKKDEKVRPRETKTGANNLQGIAITDGHLLTAASDGPRLTSTLCVYPEDIEDLDSPEQTFELPPRLEQISVSGDTVYANFEGGSSAYRDEGLAVDRVLSLDKELLIGG